MQDRGNEPELTEVRGEERIRDMRFDGNGDNPSWIDPGNRDTLDRLAADAQRRLHPFIGAAVRDRHATEDVLQETLLTMLERLPGLRRPERFWPWVYRIASNKVRDHFRRQQRFSALKRNVQVRTADEKTGALERMIDVENAGELSIAIGEMDWRQQQIIRLRCFEQMSYAGIANRTQMSQAQARINLHRAKTVLRKHLRSLSA